MGSLEVQMGVPEVLVHPKKCESMVNCGSGHCKFMYLSCVFVIGTKFVSCEEHLKNRCRWVKPPTHCPSQRPSWPRLPQEGQFFLQTFPTCEVFDSRVSFSCGRFCKRFLVCIDRRYQRG